MRNAHPSERSLLFHANAETTFSSVYPGSSPPSPLSALPDASPTPISAERSMIVLVAKWTGYAENSKRRPGSDQSHVYTLLTRPSTPLYQGARVKLLAVSRVGFHSPEASAPSELETYDPHVLGSIADISVLPAADGMHGARASFAIVNECARSLVALVQIDVPILTGVLRDAPQRAALCDRTTEMYMEYAGEPACEGDCGGARCEQVRYAGTDALSTNVEGGNEREDGRTPGRRRRVRKRKKQTKSTISRFGWIERNYAIRY
ncbi:hypothetical protein C8Q80DRAFT_618474 [Daedaleopsis nitida]|nr:hypothetical protein C8Q80DRAFT_618474 [Daedaleopsis nitida]